MIQNERVNSFPAIDFNLDEGSTVNQRRGAMEPDLRPCGWGGIHGEFTPVSYSRPSIKSNSLDSPYSRRFPRYLIHTSGTDITR